MDKKLKTWFWGSINSNELDWSPMKKRTSFFQCVLCGRLHKSGKEINVNQVFIRGRGGGIAHSDCLPTTVF